MKKDERERALALAGAGDFTGCVELFIAGAPLTGADARWLAITLKKLDEVALLREIEARADQAPEPVAQLLAEVVYHRPIRDSLSLSVLRELAVGGQAATVLAPLQFAAALREEPLGVPVQLLVDSLDTVSGKRLESLLGAVAALPEPLTPPQAARLVPFLRAKQAGVRAAAGRAAAVHVESLDEEGRETLTSLAEDKSARVRAQLGRAVVASAVTAAGSGPSLVLPPATLRRWVSKRPSRVRGGDARLAAIVAAILLGLQSEEPDPELRAWWEVGLRDDDPLLAAACCNRMLAEVNRDEAYAAELRAAGLPAPVDDVDARLRAALGL